MKKLVLMLLLFSFGLFLLACSDTTEETTTTETVTTEAPTTEVQDAVLADMYEGSHTVSAMGSDVVYQYEIHFTDGDYFFFSAFEMAGESYTFEESGTYSVSGTEITITPEGEDAVTGEYLEDGNISIPIKASAMASRGARGLTVVEVSRFYMGSHEVSAMGSTVVYHYQLILAFGEYAFVSEFEMAEETYQFFEYGTYDIDGSVITISPEAGDPVVGSIGDGTITIGIQASAMGSRAERTLTASPIAMFYEGSHVVSAMGSEVTYQYTIKFMNGAYHFLSTFVMAETTYEYEEMGTYVIDGMDITLSMDGEDDIMGEINANYTLTIPVKASAMGGREDRTLTIFIPEEVVTEVIE
jgi:hypothetical protein